MTKEESIRHLHAAQLMLLGKDNQPVSDLYYALELAISALEQPDIEAIRQEIAEEMIDVDIDMGQEIIYNNAIKDVLRIIDKHIGRTTR